MPLTDWVRIYGSTKLHHVELLKHLLNEKGIPAVILNRQDSFYITIGEIDLMVPRNYVIPAKKIITEADL